MLNAMQRFFISNKDAAIKLAKKIRPDLQDSWPSNSGKTTQYLKDRLSVTTKYNWIMIQLGNKMSIGISYQPDFYGRYISMEDFITAKNNGLKFKLWRFYDDPDFKKGLHEDVNKDLELHDYLIALGVPEPTPQEMYDYYYED